MNCHMKKNRRFKKNHHNSENIRNTLRPSKVVLLYLSRLYLIFQCIKIDSYRTYKWNKILNNLTYKHHNPWFTNWLFKDLLLSYLRKYCQENSISSEITKFFLGKHGIHQCHTANRNISRQIRKKAKAQGLWKFFQLSNKNVGRTSLLLDCQWKSTSVWLGFFVNSCRYGKIT